MLLLLVQCTLLVSLCENILYCLYCALVEFTERKHALCSMILLNISHKQL